MRCFLKILFFIFSRARAKLDMLDMKFLNSKQMGGFQRIAEPTPNKRLSSLGQVSLETHYRPSQKTWNVEWPKLIFWFLWLWPSLGGARTPSQLFSIFSIVSPTSLPPSTHAREIRKLISFIRHSMYFDSVCNVFLTIPGLNWKVVYWGWVRQFAGSHPFALNS